MEPKSSQFINPTAHSAGGYPVLGLGPYSRKGYGMSLQVDNEPYQKSRRVPTMAAHAFKPQIGLQTTHLGVSKNQGP